MCRIFFTFFCLVVVGVSGFIFLTSESGIDSDNLIESLNFTLVDPQMAPPDIRPTVMRGYHIILETKKYLPEYTGDRINCTNCHFAGGNTLGGVKEGISLVGVTKKYPRKLDDGTELSLPQRINSCFKKSLNGKPLPVDSEPMKTMIVYLEWISSPVMNIEKMSWLGQKPIESTHVPNPLNGERLFHIYCSTCHGDDGQGQDRGEDLGYPPLWGPDSFNTQAGMNDLIYITPFIYQNMPYNDPDLSKEDALDIASFIIKQPRPTK